MNKFLITESPLTFQPTLATVVGLNEAIVLQQVQYWISNPKGGVIIDGQKWVYNSYKEWQETNFPFWSEKTVERAFLGLERLGILISAQLSESKWDKTKYYRIDYVKLDDLVAPFRQDDPVDNDNLTPSTITETTSDNMSSDENTSFCRHCNAPIFYDARDTLWFHVKRAGKEDNGYYCAGTRNPAAPTRKPASPDVKPRPVTPLPIEWQIAAGQEITAVNNDDMARMDVANLLSMGKGINTHLAYSLAYTFMSTRGIIIPEGKIKGNRKPLKEMIEMGVRPEHVAEATKKLMDDNMTVVDLFSISKTAIGIANPAPETYTGALDGV